MNASHSKTLPLSPKGAERILAFGAHMNNTLCAVSGGKAFISAIVGDLENPAACLAHQSTAQFLLKRLQGGPPIILAHDLHPDFFSTRVALELAAQVDARAVPVQHHHAHIAAVRAEHNCAEPVLGLALDGMGWGSDSRLWGGELLYVDDLGFKRLGQLYPLAQPGGERAVREPWRMAAAALHAMGRADEIVTRFQHHSDAPRVLMLLERAVRCPKTSSMGRVFDAASALLGLCELAASPSQAPLALEKLASSAPMQAAWHSGWTITPDAGLDLRPLLSRLADEPDAIAGTSYLHSTVAAALVDWVRQCSDRTGINIVIAAGGCLANRLLHQLLISGLREIGLTLLTAQELSPGDAAISYGQAAAVRSLLYPRRGG